MTELYWISVLGKIYSVCLFVGLGLLLLLLWMLSQVLNEKISGTKLDKKGLKIVAVTAIATAVFLLGALFIPSEKQLYVIYGVGSVIDYVQDNDEAKTLPDNAVKAINKYIETINNEQE